MLDGNILRDAIISAANNLSNNRKRVDDLNVFPVPDGDTGTNMSMTLSNAVRELEKTQNATAGEVAKINASALLRGARGNSGVITSLLFRGFSKGIAKDEFVTAQNLAAAFKLGVEAAYKAVMKPTEGTILTVARVASEKAEEALNAGSDEIGVFEAAIGGAKVALENTPELLPALKKAGVVDAGGQGFVLILEGMLSVFKGNGIIASANNLEEKSEPAEQNLSAAGSFETDITFTYCTEFIVNVEKAYDMDEEQKFKGYLESIGDCVVVVSDDDIIKVHVHTNHPGLAFEKGLTYGSLSRMKIDNMREEHHERLIQNASNVAQTPETPAEAKKEEAPASNEPRKPYGFIAVSIGKGLGEIFKGIGADYLIEGGQTMNPSTEDMLNAIEKVNADVIYILPNNKNIILAAEQAKSLVEDKKIFVVPSRTVPQGIAALINFLPDLSPEENLENMTSEMGRIHTGQITYAVRNTNIDGMEIHEGDIMGIGDSGMLAVGQNVNETVLETLKHLVDDESELISVYSGEDVTEEDAAALVEKVQAAFPNCEVELNDGGQPIYYYLLSVE